MAETTHQSHVFIASGGKVRTLYTDDLPLKELGKLELRRASHVEASHDLSDAAIDWMWGNRHTNLWRGEKLGLDLDRERSRLRAALSSEDWWADMLPSNGPVLGPFDSRQGALDAEVNWLRERGLPQPQ